MWSRPTEIPLNRYGSFVLALTLAAGFAAGSVSAGGIYKWTDANGKVHFSDTPRRAGAEELDVGKRGNVQMMEKSTPADQEANRKRLADLEKRRKLLRDQAHRDDVKRARRNRGPQFLRRDAAKEPKWRQRAIDSCQSGGFRKNCDSEKEIQKRRPVPEAKRQNRRERLMKRQEQLMREARR